MAATDGGTGPFRRLNPLTKLVLAVGVTVLAFLMPDWRGTAVLVVLILIVALSAGLFRRVAGTAAVLTVPLLLGLLIIQGIFYAENETPLFGIGPVTVWEEGILYGVQVYLRVLVVVCAVLLVVLSTPPKRMMVALTDKGLSPKLAYVFMASLQFLPDMRRRARAILEAQQARGLDLEASLPRRFRALLVTLVPLLGGALISAETRSLALEARGFGRTGPRTNLFEVPDGAIDRALRWATLAVVLAVAVWKVVAWVL